VKSSIQNAKRKEKETYGGFIEKQKLNLYNDKEDNVAVESKGWAQMMVEMLGTAAFGLVDKCVNCCRKKKKAE